MTTDEIVEKISRDEYEGEKLINKFRIVIASLYVLVVIVFAITREIGNLEPFPRYGFIPNSVFLLYSVILYFYLKKRETVDKNFKYMCVIFDMTIISVSIWVGCTYPEVDPPIQYLSIWALFYGILILLGAFRYSVRCAIFSGIYAGFCYLVVVIANMNALDFPYYFMMDSREIPVAFPVYNESFRILAMIVTGVITGIACKRHLALFSNMIDSEAAAADAASRTMRQTRVMAKTIRVSTDEILQSSINIFSTANSQAASIQEVESTVNENVQIAVDISEKIAGVADAASKMENNIINGFSVLERNVNQLEDIKKMNDRVINGIIALGNKITKIRDIIKSINTITDQTKVIAFNAALEAAGAGERGKRFAVVASEVNRLASDIEVLTRQMRKQVEEIQDSSTSLIVSGEESADKINEGNNLIKELEDIFRDIRSGAETTANQAQTITVSTQKQQKSSEQINVAMVDISQGLSSFIHSTEAAAASAEGLTRMIQELNVLLTSQADI